MKKILALKKHFTGKRVMTGVAVLTTLAMMAAIVIYPRHIKNSHNDAALELMRQVVLAELASNTNCCLSPWLCDSRYRFTDGVVETAEEAVAWLTELGVRPDPSVAFHVMPPAAINGVTPEGFIVFAAHNSVGSTVYVYDHIIASGSLEKVRAARENDEYGGINVGFMPSLYCYQYDAYNVAEQKSLRLGAIKLPLVWLLPAPLNIDRCLNLFTVD